MASIRRTLSPVPRPGNLTNGEACSVSSPIFKSSSSSLSSMLGSLDSQAVFLGIFTPRSSRQLEKSKLRGPIWKRAILHFFICFVVGFFLGLTPFASMNLSANIISKHQAFNFEVSPAVGNFQSHDNRITMDLISLEDAVVKSNATEDEEMVPLSLVSEDNFDNRSGAQESSLETQKLLIIVTPTFSRPLQAYYLNRLGQTLKLVRPPLLWIVVEPISQSEKTAEILRRTEIMYRHLVCRKNISDIRYGKVHQRNVALSHIETHQLDGIVYFADEDNIYSKDLFQKMRQIRRFGTWAVAEPMGYDIRTMLEGPICNGSQVIGWHINESNMRIRRFHADMSGFAFNSTILWDPKRWHRPTLEPIRQLDTVKDGFQVSTFIEQVVEDESQMEGLLQDCSRIMVWNVHLGSPNAFYPHEWLLMNNLDTITSRA